LARERIRNFLAEKPDVETIGECADVKESLDRVKELHPLFHGDYAVVLHDGSRLNLSRGYRDRMQRLLFP